MNISIGKGWRLLRLFYSYLFIVIVGTPFQIIAMLQENNEKISSSSVPIKEISSVRLVNGSRGGALPSSTGESTPVRNKSFCNLKL